MDHSRGSQGRSHPYSTHSTLNTVVRQPLAGDSVTSLPNEQGIACTVFEPTTGIVMHIITDQPGLQFYSGNFFKGDETGKRGNVNSYRCGGIALEAQNFPDAINHANFPSPILRPGETYKQTTIYRFEVTK